MITSLITFWLTAAKLTCRCNTLRTLNSFARSDTGVVLDSEPHPSHKCKQVSCLLHWLYVFKLAVPLFRFTLRQSRLYDYVLSWFHEHSKNWIHLFWRESSDFHSKFFCDFHTVFFCASHKSERTSCILYFSKTNSYFQGWFYKIPGQFQDKRHFFPGPRSNFSRSVRTL